MKQIIFTFFFFILALAGFSQDTYYWVGGMNGAFSAAASWNTALNGSGTERATPDVADVLIFDGSNIGGTTPATGTVVPQIDGGFTVKQMFFQNASMVTLKRNTGASSGTSNIRIAGDANLATVDFQVDATSLVTITADATGYGTNLVIGDVGGDYATGRVFGTINIVDGGFATTRITASNSSSLIVEAGGAISSQSTFPSNYPFGTSTASTPAASMGVEFRAGSKLIYVAGVSVLGNTAVFQPAKFDAGSVLEMNAGAPAGMFNSKTFANLLIKAPAVVSLGETFYTIDTLTVNSGATFNIRTSGSSAFTGNIINNGTFGAGTPTSANLVMIGTVPQTIGGTGTFNNLGAIAVGTDAMVTLNRSLNIVGTTTSNITGALNAQTNVISGTGNLQFRTAVAGTQTAATITAGSNAVVLADATAYNGANVSVGARVVGPAFEAGTYVIATSSGSFTFTISKPAIANFPGLTGVVTLNTSAASLETANTNGVDGTITTTGTKSYGTGTSYIFDAPTLAPFPVSATSTAGDITFNASATTNKPMQRLDGTLTLNAGVLTIANTDTIRITSGNAIAGAPFSSTKFIRSAVSGANTGTLRMDNITAATTFPVGTAANYLPVVLTPSSAMDFAVSVFEGITIDGQPGSAAASAGDKSKSVDAVWTINRVNGSGDCGVELNWTNTLEGATFATLADGQIGISRYDGTMYLPATGSGNNSTNVATSLFADFSPFIVTQNAVVLPVQLKSVSASLRAAGVEVSWQVENEINIVRYEVQKSVEGNDFKTIGSVAGAGKQGYAFTDVQPSKAVAYYRLKIINANGDVKYSSVVVVKPAGIHSIHLYPNPAADVVSFSGLAGNTIIRISNAQGIQVLSQKTNAATQSIDVSALAKGLYIAEIFVDGVRTSSLRFSKQ